MFRTINLKKLLLSLGLAIGGGFLAGAIAGTGTETYSQLVKPPLSPPGVVFGIVWTILYFCMGLASYLIWDGPESPERRRGLMLYVIGLLVNFCWPLFFFRIHLYCFSAVWLGILIILVALCTLIFYRQNTTAGKLMLPYLLWCLFALYLNIGVCVLN